MKSSQKRILLSFVALGLLTSLASCNTPDSKFSIMYGTYTNTASVELSYSDLTAKMNDKENMLIAIYPEDGCQCWGQFSIIIDDYVKNEHTIVYKIKYSSIEGNGNSWGFPLDSTRPSFCYIKEGKIVKSYTYDTSSTSRFFKTLADFKADIDANCYQPNYYFVDQTYLDDKLFTAKEDKVLVGYIWKSCPDCNYCIPNVLAPYQQGKNFEQKMYIIDLEVEGLLLVNGVKDKTNANYVNFMKGHNLSDASGSDFGYSRGFVPSFQYWEQGILKDADVFFNDTLTQDDQGKIHVTQSFFTEERKTVLHYLDGVETTVLQGMEVPLEDVTIYVDYGNYIAWNAASASKYHAPLLNAFLETYMK